ncbi:transcriptional regulator [Sporolactobacillus sp. THM7-7]|nr:transcriptional regulator [Sporolactobacillus sp. THM7-7]
MNSEFTIAVHCLIELAKNTSGHLYSSEALSQKVHTHSARVRKIMSTLRKNELVVTKEGIRGGYRLNLDPREITLALVYRAIACEALKLNWCSCSESDPELISVRMVMDQAFGEAEVLLEEYLERLTIDSLLRQAEKVRESLSCLCPENIPSDPQSIDK